MLRGADLRRGAAREQDAPHKRETSDAETGDPAVPPRFPPESAWSRLTGQAKSCIPTANIAGRVPYPAIFLVFQTALRSRALRERRNASCRSVATARTEIGPMKIRNSLKSLRDRHRDCRLVRRRGRVYVINKTQKRFKARQG